MLVQVIVNCSRESFADLRGCSRHGLQEFHLLEKLLPFKLEVWGSREGHRVTGLISDSALVASVNLGDSTLISAFSCSMVKALLSVQGLPYTISERTCITNSSRVPGFERSVAVSHRIILIPQYREPRVQYSQYLL